MQTNFFTSLVKVTRSFLKTDFGVALLITLIWKVVMTLIGFVIDTYFGGATSLIDHTMRWDAGWYLTIINGHYGDNLAASAFYPLFPLLVSTVHFLSFGFIDIPIAGQLVNTIAVWLALTALIKLGREIMGDKKKFWLLILVLSTPAAIFFHVFYSEAVFAALAFWAYYFALTRRWLGVGILLAFLTAARLPSILVVALCGLEFLRAYDWKPKKFFNKNLLFFLLAPLGFIAYATYLSIVQHDPLGMFHAYHQTTDWIYHVFNPNILGTVTEQLHQAILGLVGLQPRNLNLFINVLLPLTSLVILVISSAYLVIKQRARFLPLGIVGILSFIMFTLNSNVVSVHRYLLPSLTIYVAAALFIAAIKKPRLLYAWLILGGIGQLILFVAFIHYFAG